MQEWIVDTSENHGGQRLKSRRDNSEFRQPCALSTDHVLEVAE